MGVQGGLVVGLGEMVRMVGLVEGRVGTVWQAGAAAFAMELWVEMAAPAGRRAVVPLAGEAMVVVGMVVVAMVEVAKVAGWQEVAMAEMEGAEVAVAGSAAHLRAAMALGEVPQAMAGVQWDQAQQARERQAWVAVEGKSVVEEMYRRLD